MKSLTGRKALSHERIIKSGSLAVRRAGFHGVSVADVMKDAGLTHGGFYAHFESRDGLLAQSVLQASADIAVNIRGHMTRLTQAGVSPFRALVETYLYEGHIRDCMNGCPVAALSAEMPTQSPEVLAASRRIVNILHEMVEQSLAPEVASGAAWNITAALIGAVQLARVMGNSRQGQEVLASAKNELLEKYDRPGATAGGKPRRASRQ